MELNLENINAIFIAHDNDEAKKYALLDDYHDFTNYMQSNFMHEFEVAVEFGQIKDLEDVGKFLIDVLGRKWIETFPV